MKIAKSLFCIAGAALLGSLVSGCNSRADLNEQPNLERAFRLSNVYYQLHNRGIVTVQLDCRWPSKQISARFEFEHLDGRAPVEVNGTTPCTESGALLRVDYGSVLRAKENYQVSMVELNLTDLLAKAAIKPAVRDVSRGAAERALSEKFSKAIAAARFEQVTFFCEKTGEPYQYYEDLANGIRQRRVSLQLKTKCPKAHQNFSVLRSAAADGLVVKPDDPLVYIHDYNSPPVSSMEAVFAEYIQEKPTTSTF